MIDFNCPHCRKHISAPDKASGRMAACTGCGERIQIPVVGDEPVDVEQPAARAESTEPKRQKEVWVKTAAGASGPFSTATIKEMAADGEIQPADMVSFDRKTWREASTIKGLEFGEPKPTGPSIADRAKSGLSAINTAMYGAAEWAGNKFNERRAAKAEQQRIAQESAAKRIESASIYDDVDVVDAVPIHSQRGSPAVVHQADFMQQLEVQRGSSPVYVTVERQKERPSNSMGIAALILGILSLPFCWIPLLNVITIPLSGLGILMAGIAFLLGILRNGTGLGYSLAGGLVCAMSLFFSVGTNAVLIGGATAVVEANREQRAKENRVALPTAATAEQAGEGRPVDPKSVGVTEGPKYVEFGKGAMIGDVKVALTRARIANADLKHSFRDQVTQTDKKYLIIDLTIQNASETKKMNYRPWGRDYHSFRGDSADLKDNFGNDYRGQEYGSTMVTVGLPGHIEAVYPGKEQSDVLLFEVPIDKAEYVELTLPGSKAGATGKFVFRIPMDKITK